MTLSLFLGEMGNVCADAGRYLLSTLADPQSTMSERGNAASHFDKHQSQLPEELSHEIGTQQKKKTMIAIKCVCYKLGDR